MKVAENKVHRDCHKKNQPVNRVILIKSAVHPAFRETFPGEKMEEAGSRGVLSLFTSCTAKV